MKAIAMVDYKDRFFDSLVEDIKEIKSDTGSIRSDLKKLNSRTAKLEGEVYNQVARKDLAPIWKDPKVIQVVLYLSLALLILVAAATRVDLGGLL